MDDVDENIEQICAKGISLAYFFSSERRFVNTMYNFRFKHENTQVPDALAADCPDEAAGWNINIE